MAIPHPATRVHLLTLTTLCPSQVSGEGGTGAAQKGNSYTLELSVLQQQCLDRRIPDEATLTREIAAWEHQRNVEQATIDWRFSVSDARKKLKRLYPSLPA
jgi:hypothetical protein